jgi:membrane protein DedA with SNARE-associated domain
MAEEQIEAEKAADTGPAPARRRIVSAVPPWLLRRLGRTPRWLLVALGMAVLATVVVGTVLPFALGWVSQDDLETLGYPGIFLANFLGTATVFVPVPGLTAAGQALIVAGAQRLNPVGVVAAGVAGMTLAESTAYLAGMVGRQVAEERPMPLGGRPGQWLRRAAGWVDRLMARYGFATLLVLSALPNPVFEFAGITAGAVRMNFWRFLLAVGIGKTARVILLVIVGDALLDLFDM